MTLLQLAYVLDVLVAFPIALTTLLGSESTAPSVLGDKLPERKDNRIMLGALWTAIAVCGAIGILFPVVMSPILILQLIYKSLWIICFAVPRWLRGRSGEVPWRIAATFIAFVAVYPWVIPWSELVRQQ